MKQTEGCGVAVVVQPPRSLHNHARARQAEARRQLERWERLTGPTPAGPQRETGTVPLTVGVATYDDFHGLWFTVASVALHHPEIAGRVEFLILDNWPTGDTADEIAAFAGSLHQARYLPFRGYAGTSARDLLFREARGDVVVCLDSHVLVRPGGFAALLDYFDARPGCRDLVQGPLLADDLTTVRATHLEPVWRRGMWGDWGNNHRGDDPSAEPYPIDMMGLGLFACRRDAWPGLHPSLRGFGAEEGYLHEKVRRHGGRTVGLPALGWAHRFQRPGGPPYPNLMLERVRNYELAWDELGWDLEPGRQHYRDLGVEEDLLAQARSEASNPAAVVDGILAVAPEVNPASWFALMDRLRPLGLDWRVERIGAPEASNREVSRALGWRAALSEAHRRHWDSVMILDEDASLGSDGDVVRADLEAWQVSTAATARLAGGPGAVRIVRMNAIADLRDELPASTEGMEAWLQAHGAVSDWLDARTGDRS